MKTSLSIFHTDGSFGCGNIDHGRGRDADLPGKGTWILQVPQGCDEPDRPFRFARHPENIGLSSDLRGVQAVVKYDTRRVKGKERLLPALINTDRAVETAFLRYVVP